MVLWQCVVHVYIFSVSFAIRIPWRGFSWLKINETYGIRIWFHLVACNKQVLFLNPWNRLEPVVLPRQFTDSMRSWECWLVGCPKIVSRRWGECVNVKKIYQDLSNVKCIQMSNLYHFLVLWKVKWRWCYMMLHQSRRSWRVLKWTLCWRDSGLGACKVRKRLKPLSLPKRGVDA